MATILHILDEQGHFEQLDSEHLHLYSHINVENDKDKLIELTAEQEAELNALNGTVRYVDGKFVVDEQAVEIDLNSAKQALIRKITEKTDRLKSSLTASYPQTEIESFYRQEQEAREFLAGKIETPEMLSQIAKVRNLPLNLLAQAVVRKADQLAGIIGAILGQKQKLEAKAEKADNLEMLAEIETEVEQWSI